MLHKNQMVVNIDNTRTDTADVYVSNPKSNVGWVKGYFGKVRVHKTPSPNRWKIVKT